MLQRMCDTLINMIKYEVVIACSILQTEFHLH